MKKEEESRRKNKEEGRKKNKEERKEEENCWVGGCELVCIKKPTASFGSGRLSFMMSMFDCLRWLDSSVRASVNTCTAVCASVGINRINITCRDSA